MLPTHRPPTHPGEMLLKELLEPRGVSQVEAARRMNIPFQRLNAIVKGRRGLSPDTALHEVHWHGEADLAVLSSGPHGPFEPAFSHRGCPAAWGPAARGVMRWRSGHENTASLADQPRRLAFARRTRLQPPRLGEPAVRLLPRPPGRWPLGGGALGVCPVSWGERCLQPEWPPGGAAARSNGRLRHLPPTETRVHGERSLPGVSLRDDGRRDLPGRFRARLAGTVAVGVLRVARRRVLPDEQGGCLDLSQGRPTGR